jgi:hypothetical protein
VAGTRSIFVAGDEILGELDGDDESRGWRKAKDEE